MPPQAPPPPTAAKAKKGKGSGKGGAKGSNTSSTVSTPTAPHAGDFFEGREMFGRNMLTPEQQQQQLQQQLQQQQHNQHVDPGLPMQGGNMGSGGFQTHSAPINRFGHRGGGAGAMNYHGRGGGGSAAGRTGNETAGSSGAAPSRSGGGGGGAQPGGMFPGGLPFPPHMMRLFLDNAFGAGAPSMIPGGAGIGQLGLGQPQPPRNTMMPNPMLHHQLHHNAANAAAASNGGGGGSGGTPTGAAAGSSTNSGVEAGHAAAPMHQNQGQGGRYNGGGASGHHHNHQQPQQPLSRNRIQYHNRGGGSGGASPSEGSQHHAQTPPAIPSHMRTPGNASPASSSFSAADGVAPSSGGGGGVTMPLNNPNVNLAGRGARRHGGGGGNGGAGPSFNYHPHHQHAHHNIGRGGSGAAAAAQQQPLEAPIYEFFNGQDMWGEWRAHTVIASYGNIGSFCEAVAPTVPTMHHCVVTDAPTPEELQTPAQLMLEPVYSLDRLWEWYDRPFGLSIPLPVPTNLNPSMTNDMPGRDREVFYTPYLSAFHFAFAPDSRHYAKLLREAKRAAAAAVTAAAAASSQIGGDASASEANLQSRATPPPSEDATTARTKTHAQHQPHSHHHHHAFHNMYRSRHASEAPPPPGTPPPRFVTWTAAEKPDSRAPLFDQMAELLRTQFPFLQGALSCDFECQSWYAVLWEPIHCHGHSSSYSCGTVITYHLVRPPRHLFEPVRADLVQSATDAASSVGVVTPSVASPVAASAASGPATPAGKSFNGETMLASSGVTVLSTTTQGSPTNLADSTRDDQNAGDLAAAAAAAAAAGGRRGSAVSVTSTTSHSTGILPPSLERKIAFQRVVGPMLSQVNCACEAPVFFCDRLRLGGDLFAGPGALAEIEARRQYSHIATSVLSAAERDAASASRLVASWAANPARLSELRSTISPFVLHSRVDIDNMPPRSQVFVNGQQRFAVLLSGSENTVAAAERALAAALAAASNSGAGMATNGSSNSADGSAYGLGAPQLSDAVLEQEEEEEKVAGMMARTETAAGINDDADDAENDGASVRSSNDVGAGGGGDSVGPGVFAISPSEGSLLQSPTQPFDGSFPQAGSGAASTINAGDPSFAATSPSAAASSPAAPVSSVYQFKSSRVPVCGMVWVRLRSDVWLVPTLHTAAATSATHYAPISLFASALQLLDAFHEALHIANAARHPHTAFEFEKGNIDADHFVRHDRHLQDFASSVV